MTMIPQTIKKAPSLVSRIWMGLIFLTPRVIRRPIKAWLAARPHTIKDRKGQPVAVVLPAHEYAALIEHADARDRAGWTKLGEEVFHSIWDNPEDEVYAELLKR